MERTKKFHRPESDRAHLAHNAVEDTSGGGGKVGMYRSKRFKLRNRGRSGNVRETKRSKLEGRTRADEKEGRERERDEKGEKRMVPQLLETPERAKDMGGGR